MPNQKPSENPKNEASIDELLTQAGVQVTNVVAPPEETPAKEEPQGGAFRSSDGRWLYKYVVGEDTIVLPKPLEQMSEEDFYSLPISMASSMPGRIPQNLTVKFKDPQWAGHWFNRKAQDGRRISEARALGFVPAKREDCEWIAHSLNDEDGAVMDNDLILMKIYKAKLFMQYKSWMDLARIKGGTKAYKQAGEGVVGNSGGKVGHFLTPQAEQEYQGLGPVTQLNTVS